MDTTIPRRAAALLAVALLGPLAAAAPKGTPREASSVMDSVAEDYVRLVLGLGEHDADYVDAYYGPAEVREQVKAKKPSLEEIHAGATAALARLDPLAAGGGDPLLPLRQSYLQAQLRALAARVEMLQGKKLSFDEESRRLYDTEAPHHDEAYFKAFLAELEPLLPGKGPLSARFSAYRDRFAVPKDKLDAVFRAAVDECRQRTRAHLALPEGESFEVEFVTDKPWSAYNWYKGNYHSVIQVNTQLPVIIDRVLHLAGHEGYPGHHVYNALLEKNLVRDRKWPEYAVYALFSPQSLIAEGSANFGVEVAFPGQERLAFEREVLYPLAGLDPEQAERFDQVRRLGDRLAYAGNEAARRYLDGRIDAEEAARWLETYALMSPERARQRVKFFDRYRSYVINYNVGEDLVRDWVVAQGGTADKREQRWKVFGELLSSPRLPGTLR